MLLSSKIKKVVIILLFFSLFLGNINVFAITFREKGKILKDFKGLEYKLLFESDTIFLDGEAKKIFNESNKYRLYNGIRKKVQKKREFLENENNKITNKLTNLSDSLNILDKEIRSIREEAFKINHQIIELKRSSRIKTRTIRLLKKKIKVNKEILYKYITYLYKKGNYVFKDGKIDNLKAIFFGGDDISSVLNDLHFKGLIEFSGKRLIEKHRKYINTLYIEQIGLKKSELETKSLRKQLIIQKAVIQQKRDFKQKLIKISKGKQQIFQNFINNKIKTEKKLKIKEFITRLNFKKGTKELLKNEGCRLVDFSKISKGKIKISEKCRQLNTVIYIDSKLKGFKKDKAGNLLKWPVKPINGISTYFHDQGYINTFGEDHDALDIPVKQGTDIKAPADGYVIHIDKPTKNGYSYIALKHADGLVTVYGHLSKTKVKKLQFIKEGESFAKTGGIPGTSGAGPLTTGPHLHFEVWKNKRLIDPITFLNISILNPNNIPSLYFSKYKKDFKAIKGVSFKGKLEKNRKYRTFKIVGKNEIERQKNFLNKYGVGGFKKWNLWVEEGIEASIDPTFIMCVGLAETGLGRNLKTRYNVGNVGNTDSGATKTFRSERDGIAAMTRTFNNKYLKQYNELKLLSRYGNKNGKKPIYASSPRNWHNNIMTCMSHIKGIYISDNYNFRLKN